VFGKTSVAPGSENGGPGWGGADQEKEARKLKMECALTTSENRSKGPAYAASQEGLEKICEVHLGNKGGEGRKLTGRRGSSVDGKELVSPKKAAAAI